MKDELKAPLAHKETILLTYKITMQMAVMWYTPE